MSSASLHLHPLIVRLRAEVEAEDFLTYEEIAGEIGVSLRALSGWMNDPIVPKKTQRKLIAAWLDQRGVNLNGEAA